jgi:hypothetical protein
MGKCSPHSNESFRRKERNGKSNRHQHHEVEKNKLPQGKPPTSEGLKVFQDHTWKDKKRWHEYILKNHQDTHPLPTESYTPIVPATSTKTTDFFTREPSCRQAIRKYLKSSSVRTEDKHRLIQIIANRFPVNVSRANSKKKNPTDATYADGPYKQPGQQQPKKISQSRQ